VLWGVVGGPHAGRNGLASSGKNGKMENVWEDKNKKKKPKKRINPPSLRRKRSATKCRDRRSTGQEKGGRGRSGGDGGGNISSAGVAEKREEDSHKKIKRNYHSEKTGEKCLRTTIEKGTRANIREGMV